LTQATVSKPVGGEIAGSAKPLAAPRIIALMNQKGGVGKTTTTVNLGAALAQAGHRVLFIDLDPQAHLTLHLGVDPDTLDRSVYHVLTDPGVTAASVARSVGENMAVLPGETNLAGVETELAALAASGRAQRVLRDKCAGMISGGVREDASGNGTTPQSPIPQPPTPSPLPYDFVLIDCPPSLGLLTLNALALAGEVFVPMQAHFLALQGLSKLLETVALVKQSVNPALRVTGIILCMYEGQTVLAGEVLADLGSFLDAARGMAVPWRDAVVLKPAIRRNIKLAECPSFGKSIFEYAYNSGGASDYRSLAEAVGAMAVKA
jgi:chromosome partitioning protein